MDENKDYFKINANSGGYFGFEGVFDNNKEVDYIEVDRANSTATVYYADGCTFAVSATITKVNGKYIVSNISRSWSGGA